MSGSITQSQLLDIKQKVWYLGDDVLSVVSWKVSLGVGILSYKICTFLRGT